MLIDAYAHTPADVADLAPLWWRLPLDNRRTFHAHRQALDAARAEGLWPLSQAVPLELGTNPLVVTERMGARPWRRPLAVLDGSFAREPVPDLGHLWLAAGPREGVPAEHVVGVPRLDWWASRPRPATYGGVAAFALAEYAPDSGEQVAFAGWTQALHAVAGRGLLIYGFGTARGLGAEVRAAGGVWVERLEHVLDGARLLISDDRRLLVAFAACTGRPVVPLRSPWRDPGCDDLGPVAEHPEQLPQALAMALDDPPRWRVNRRAAAHAVYPHPDGHAAERAVQAIMEAYA